MDDLVRPRGTRRGRIRTEEGSVERLARSGQGAPGRGARLQWAKRRTTERGARTRSGRSGARDAEIRGRVQAGGEAEGRTEREPEEQPEPQGAPREVVHGDGRPRLKR